MRPVEFSNYHGALSPQEAEKLLPHLPEMVPPKEQSLQALALLKPSRPASPLQSSSQASFKFVKLGCRQSCALWLCAAHELASQQAATCLAKVVRILISHFANSVLAALATK